ncbi:MAG: orotidine-5'-phosphate decarboxylase [Legionella sp.]|nr:MAG: orotidine-5'-phosphate decarboxylase [Legionella sp.]
MSKLIIALDFDRPEDALSLVEQFEPEQCAFKIGSELFTRSGPDVVRQIIARGFRVFLDLKFHDIPNTVAQSCKAAADLGVWMLTVHAAGGAAMLHAARTALESYGASRPKLIAVTVLTSLSEADLSGMGVSGTLLQHVERYAVLSQQAGLDGVVSSAQEVARLRTLCGRGFLLVTPGIRMAGDVAHDQSRVISPQDALQAGSDYLVMGRSITRAQHPRAVVDALNSL